MCCDEDNGGGGGRRRPEGFLFIGTLPFSPWRGFIGGERTGEMELAELIGLAISLYRCSESRVSDDDDLLMLPELDLDRLLSVELDRILSLRFRAGSTLGLSDGAGPPRPSPAPLLPNPSPGLRLDFPPGCIAI